MPIRTSECFYLLFWIIRIVKKIKHSFVTLIILLSHRFRSNFSTGTHQSSLGDRYDGDRFGDRYRDDDNYRYSQERDGSYRDDDRYGRNPDRYGRDEYNQGRSRSADRPRGRSFDDDDRHSSRYSLILSHIWKMNVVFISNIPIFLLCIH